MPTSLYLHIPFCRHRCAYCDFNTYEGMEDQIADYMPALQREVRTLGDGLEDTVGTVFFGGGTPSLVPAGMLGETIRVIEDSFEIEDCAEVSLEANPGTLSPGYLARIRAAGVNRLSIGMQSSSPDDLRVLEREHDFFDVVHSVAWAREAGFDNVNLDLIFGLPGQSLQSWERSLDSGIGIRPEHLSVYHLTLEHGTPMKAWVDRGLLPVPEGDLAADMYEHTRDRLAAAGYMQYEISNWALGSAAEGNMCRHNLQYWRNLPYLGLGAGAHGYAGGFRTANVRAPGAYIERMSASAARQFPRSQATVHFQEVDRAGEMGETMMMGLRLVGEGVKNTAFRERFGLDIAQAFPQALDALLEKGLVEWRSGSLRLTARGVLLGNRVFMRFLQ